MKDNSYNQTIVDSILGNDYGPVECVCPPRGIPVLDTIQDICMIFLTVELFLRILCYVPNNSTSTNETSTKRCITCCESFKQWAKFLTRPSTIIDALSILPFVLENIFEVPGLLGLLTLRIFRLLTLFRFGKYSATFRTLCTVFIKSLISLNILLFVMFIGAAFFGSLMF